MTKRGDDRHPDSDAASQDLESNFKRPTSGVSTDMIGRIHVSDSQPAMSLSSITSEFDRSQNAKIEVLNILFFWVIASNLIVL